MLVSSLHPALKSKLTDPVMTSPLQSNRELKLSTFTAEPVIQDDPLRTQAPLPPRFIPVLMSDVTITPAAQATALEIVTDSAFSSPPPTSGPTANAVITGPLPPSEATSILCHLRSNTTSYLGWKDLVAGPPEVTLQRGTR